MERILERSLLYDFYGELLTNHQRKLYELFLFQDYSLGEIAEQEGISRQGVHDLVKRCDALLEEYEQKLHLLKRFMKVKKELEEILVISNTAAERTVSEQKRCEMLESIKQRLNLVLEDL